MIGYPCPKCQTPNAVPNSWDICGNCKRGKKSPPVSKKEKEPLTVKGTEITEGLFMYEEKGKGGLQKGSGQMKKFIAGRGVLIVKSLGDALKFTVAPKGFGDQWTIDEEGTLSIDYQGARESGAVIWVDLQIQFGGGSTKRYSYGQVMIQTCLGADPGKLAAAIEAAFLLSLATGNRVLLLNSIGSQNLPK